MKRKDILAALLLMVAGLQTTKAQKMRFYYSGQDTPVEYSFAGLDSMVFVDAPAAEPEYVDLGLPSGTLWATFNVGASRPEDYGDYFAWGETQPKDDYSWSTYFDTKDNGSTFEKYKNGGLTELLPTDDAATANWGRDWQMPSLEQLEELINSDYTTTERTTLNGIEGRKITSNSNGKSIFLPAASYRNRTNLPTDLASNGGYWSRSLHPKYDIFVFYLEFYKDNIVVSANRRNVGYSVRPVRKQEPKEVLIESITLNETELRIELPYENEVSRQLTATILPSNATNKTLEWESSNEAVAKVSANGRMTAVGWGNCIITCRATDGSGVYAECRVKVVDPVL